VKSHFRNWKAQYFLGLSVVFPFLFPLLSGKVIYWGTASLQFIPWASYSIDSLWNGNIPLWNPFNGMGAPFIANYQTAVFYPINWLLIPIYKFFDVSGLSIGFSILVVLHLVIAAVGFSFILKSMNRSNMAQFIGGFCWVFGGYIISRTSFISMVWSFAWVSWIIYFVMKFRGNGTNNKIKTVFQLSLVILLQLLTGHAQTFSFTMGLGLLILFIPFEPGTKENGKRFFAFIMSIFIAICVAAIQLLPTLEYLFLSQRSNEVGYEYASNFSFWPLRIVSLLFGGFWGNPGLNRFIAGGTFWEDQIYFGVFSFVFVVLLLTNFFKKKEERKFNLQEHRTIYFYLFLCFFAFLLALGKNSFLYPIFYEYFPGIRLFQGPSRFLLIFSFAFCILLAYGFDYWNGYSLKPRKIGLLTASSLAIIISTSIFYFSNPSIPIQIFISIWITSVFLLLFSLISIFKVYLDRKYTLVLQIITITFLVGDLVSQNFPFGHFITNEFYSEPALINPQSTSEKFVFIEPETENFLKFNKFFRFDRFQFLDSIQYKFPSNLPDGNLVYDRYRMLNNFDPFLPERYLSFLNWINDLTYDNQNKILSLIGVNERISLDINNATGVKNVPLQARPLIQWYKCAEFESEQNILDRMLNSANNRCIFIENQISSDGDVVKLNEEPILLKYLILDDGNININYSAKSSGWIVIRQTWYPGWVAEIDGNDQIEIKQVDFLFQGAYVPAGNHSVTILYRPKSFLLGLWISLVSLLLITIVVVFWFVNKRKQSRNIFGDVNGTINE